MEYTIKESDFEVPIRVRVSEKFPSAIPKMYATMPIKHACIDSSSLEIDYSKFYNFKQNGKVSDLIMATQSYFRSHPIDFSEESKKLEKLMQNLSP